MDNKQTQVSPVAQAQWHQSGARSMRRRGGPAIAQAPQPPRMRND